MTKLFHTATAFLSIALALNVATAAAAETKENTKLKVQIGTVYIKNVDKNELLSLKKNTVLRGKRIYVPLSVENYGTEKSEPVKLKYTEKPTTKGSEPRYYRVPSLDPGKKYQLVLTARFNESGQKEMKASLTTLEGESLADEKGRLRPGTSQTHTVTLEMRD